MEGIALNRALQGARGRVDSGLRKASQQLNEYRVAARKHYRNGKFHAQLAEGRLSARRARLRRRGIVAVLVGLGLAAGAGWLRRPTAVRMGRCVGGGLAVLGVAVWTYNAARARRKAKIWGWGSRDHLPLPA